MDPLPLTNKELKSIKHLLNLLRKHESPSIYSNFWKKGQKDIYTDDDGPDNIHGVENFNEEETIAAHIVLGSEDPTKSSSSSNQLIPSHHALQLLPTNLFDVQDNAYLVRNSTSQQAREKIDGSGHGGTNRQQRTFYEKVGDGSLERVTTLRQTNSYSTEIKRAPKRPRKAASHMCLGAPIINVKAVANVDVGVGNGCGRGGEHAARGYVEEAGSDEDE